MAVVVDMPAPGDARAADTPVAVRSLVCSLRRGLLTSNVGEACALVRCAPAARAPDIELIFAPVAYISHGFVKDPRHAITIGVVLLQPESVGSITLRSADPFTAPRDRAPISRPIPRAPTFVSWSRA